MKIVLLTISIITFIYTSYAQYNNDTVKDLVLVKTEHCYMYKSPQTIPNSIAQDSLLRFPVGLPLETCGYRDNYYKIDINGEIGYIFCMNVTTPKRIRDIRCRMLLPGAKCDAYNTLIIEDENRKQINNKIKEAELNYALWFLLK